MQAEEQRKRPDARIRIVVTKGFAIPCVFYLMVGLALYPQLGILAPMLGVTMRGQPSEGEWVVAGVGFAVIGIVGVITHELGHALIIKHKHRRTALIALTSQVGTRHTPINGKSKLMAFAGPALQALYGLAVVGVCVPIHAFYFGVLGCYIIIDAFYNLLPFRGYDGYYVFRSRKDAMLTLKQSGSPT